MSKEEFRDFINSALFNNFRNLKELLEENEEYEDIFEIFMNSFYNAKNEISSLVDELQI